MRILNIGDLHFGEKGDSEKYNQQLVEFLEWTCDLAKQRDIEICVQFGDYFHQRNKINVETLQYGRIGAEVLSRFFGKDNLYIFAGNHDLYYLSRLDVAAINGFSHLATIVNEPMALGDVLLVPWIVDNQMWDEVLTMGKDYRYMYAHLELNGFMVNDRYVMEHGYSPKELDIFDRVVTGHYHSIQSKENIHYIGSALPITMSEANEPHGVFIHDTETDEFEFIEYTKVRVVSIPHTEIHTIGNYDPDNTSIRIEFPDDLEDETLITDAQKLLESYNFTEAKIKYKGKKIQQLMDKSVEEVNEVENVDETVITFLREMTETPGVEKERLEKLYIYAKERGEATEANASKEAESV